MPAQGDAGAAPRAEAGKVPQYRWTVLAVGAAATAALAAVQGGLPALGPALREAYGLSLVEVTAIFTSFSTGTLLTVFAWGALSDRLGERLVLSAGLAAGSIALAGTAATSGYLALLASVFVAGLLGSCAVTGSGRAVIGWFPRAERGVALGLRQTAVPVGAAVASLSLPALAAALSLDAALLALAGAMLLAALAAAVWLREPPERRSAAPPAPPPTRDPRNWRLSLASALMIVGQVGVTSLLVLFLADEHGWRPARAALVLGAVQLGGAVARIAAGRWSDRRDERIEPLRRLAAASGALLLAAAALAGAPTALLVPVLALGGVLAMSWNGLSFTAAAEMSGRAQAGRAIGLQNTALRAASATVPVGLGALASAWSWAAAFAVMGVAALTGRALLRPLVDE
ncbi:MAG: MFS transporter, partial [Nocardioidaceae bacterium]